MRVYKTLESIKKDFPEAWIIEDDSGFWVYPDGHKDQKVKRYYKPRTKEHIKDILINGKFPEKLINDAIFNIKETEAIKKIKEVKKNGAVLEGMAGVGKSTACTWKIAKLLQYWKINNPLYISAVLFDTKAFETFQEHDAYLIDDLIVNLKEIKLDLIMQVIYYAESKNISLFITTNSSLKELTEQFPEPLISRILSHCEYIKIKTKEDFRLKKI
jgi:DNA replication protein DnaC